MTENPDSLDMGKTHFYGDDCDPPHVETVDDAIFCARCKGTGTIVTAGPDYYGNYDTDDCECQAPCTTCRGLRNDCPDCDSVGV